MSNQNNERRAPNPVDSSSRTSTPYGPSSPSSIPTSAPATAGATHVCKCTHAHTQLDHLGALCNHLEEASACFAAPPSGVYSDDLRRCNLSPEGAHKLPSPCSVSWDQCQGQDQGQWEIHFLLEDFMEVIEGLFADGRLNAIRSQDPASGAFGIPDASGEVYLAGEFDIEVHHSLHELGYSCCYELGFTPDTMSTVRLYALASQEELGNIRAELARYGVQLPGEDK